MRTYNSVKFFLLLGVVFNLVLLYFIRKSKASLSLLLLFETLSSIGLIVGIYFTGFKEFSQETLVALWWFVGNSLSWLKQIYAHTKKVPLTYPNPYIIAFNYFLIVYAIFECGL